MIHCNYIGQFTCPVPCLTIANSGELPVDNSSCPSGIIKEESAILPNTNVDYYVWKNDQWNLVYDVYSYVPDHGLYQHNIGILLNPAVEDDWLISVDDGTTWLDKTDLQSTITVPYSEDRDITISMKNIVTGCIYVGRTFPGRLIEFTVEFNDTLASQPYSIVDPTDVAEWRTIFGSNLYIVSGTTTSSVSFKVGRGITFGRQTQQSSFEPKCDAILDPDGAIGAIANASFHSCGFRRIILAGDVRIDNSSFYDCTNIIEIYIPNANALGNQNTPGPNGDGVFLNVTGNNIDLTIPAYFQTNEGGGMDLDLAYLIANNTVNVTYT
jgi:hypothetical protein